MAHVIQQSAAYLVANRGEMHGASIALHEPWASVPLPFMPMVMLTRPLFWKQIRPSRSAVKAPAKPIWTSLKYWMQPSVVVQMPYTPAMASYRKTKHSHRRSSMPV